MLTHTLYLHAYRATRYARYYTHSKKKVNVAQDTFTRGNKPPANPPTNKPLIQLSSNRGRLASAPKSAERNKTMQTIMTAIYLISLSLALISTLIAIVAIYDYIEYLIKGKPIPNRNVYTRITPNKYWYKPQPKKGK